MLVRVCVGAWGVHACVCPECLDLRNKSPSPAHPLANGWVTYPCQTLPDYLLLAIGRVSTLLALEAAAQMQVLRLRLLRSIHPLVPHLRSATLATVVTPLRRDVCDLSLESSPPPLAQELLSPDFCLKLERLSPVPLSALKAFNFEARLYDVMLSETL